ncbi:capsular biosynthesis protein [Cupriavidus sp. U2]|uniref:capsular polysaccharide biosynthesis protein n=1 Tax=Cupriavidus sp. U2 TaxID=2920269 RepID=UPI0020BFF49E|nr:capsular biosynthesis protein [Cupriavidus sp. U2]
MLRAEKRECVLLSDRHARTNAEAAAITRMVTAAIANHPDAAFWIWPLADGKPGYLSRMQAQLLPGAQLIHNGFSLFATLAHVDRFYTVDAPEGMQALLAGVPVHVFGAPYYAGWGLTRDDLPLPGRTARPTLAALFEVVYLRLTRYLDPESHGPGTLVQVLDSIELQRSVRARYADCASIAGVRFQVWKRRLAMPFLTVAGGGLRWSNLPLQVFPGECVALWGGKSAEGVPSGAPIIRMEDGFFHSDGLGSDMKAPCSQVLDRQGLYFDARQPSELTHILNCTYFDVVELTRAAALRQLVCRRGVTKYNLGRRMPCWQAPGGKRVILVAGQVADDASIRFGTGAIGTAEALLETVRQRNPDAFLVYKPHPDVLSGNRNGLVHANTLADVVDAHADVLSLIDRADEIHVLSSLAGFDALLRGKRVFTYGLPFYAGWGLTHDELPQPWRERELTLDMLVAGALLRYPLYWDWRTRMFTTPEAVVRLLGKTAGRPMRHVAGDLMRWPRKIWRWTCNAALFGVWTLRNRRNSTPV